MTQLFGIHLTLHQEIAIHVAIDDDEDDRRNQSEGMEAG